tara:strand:+ start:15408 stop:15626 length:219 start_codon:yes stop_codon:yes gene_type:complete
MKYKERRGNVFVFDGGYDSEELELTKKFGGYVFLNVRINPDLDIDTLHGPASYKDIQTAVNLMTILKDEGLV